MDPKATIERARQAAHAHDWAEVNAALDDLQEWVRKGGFAPEPQTDWQQFAGEMLAVQRGGPIPESWKRDPLWAEALEPEQEAMRRCHVEGHLLPAEDLLTDNEHTCKRCGGTRTINGGDVTFQMLTDEDGPELVERLDGEKA